MNKVEHSALNGAKRWESIWPWESVSGQNIPASGDWHLSNNELGFHRSRGLVWWPHRTQTFVTPALPPSPGFFSTPLSCTSLRTQALLLCVIPTVITGARRIPKLFGRYMISLLRICQLLYKPHFLPKSSKETVLQDFHSPERILLCLAFCHFSALGPLSQCLGIYPVSLHNY